MAKKKRNKSGNPAARSTQTVAGVRATAPVAQSTYSVAGSSKASTGFYNTVWFEWLSIAVVSVISFWFLTARIVGVQVSVLADEYLYLLDAHYNGLSTAKYPNYLFQWIYSSTKMCGAEFYSCARSINAFFVICGAVFIYLLAKQIGRSKLLAGLAAVAAILGSYGTYTAYFMPEAIFNGLMMVFFWAIIRFGKTDNLLVWAAIGSSLGIASLAKPHGLFVMPAVVIFIALWTRATKDKWLIPALLRNLVFVTSVVGAKFLFGYLLAGERALSLFGMYGSVESITQGAASKLVSSVSNDAGGNVFFTGWGQTLMMTMIIGVALPVAIHGFILGFKRSSELFEQVKFRALLGIALLNMMGAIAMFEALINFDVWMHTRYYTYLIPLAFVVLIEALRNSEKKVWPWAKYSVIAIFLGLSIFNLVTNAAPYSSNWIDAPDFRAHIDNLVIAQFSIVIGIIAAIAWIWTSRLAIGITLILALFLSIFSGAHNSSFLRTTFGEETVYESLSRLIRDFLPQEEADGLLMVGQFEMLQRTAFSSLTGSVQILGTPETALAYSSVDETRTWLLTIGDPVIEGFAEPTIKGLGYNLYSLKDSNSLLPRNNRVTSFSSGCSQAEYSQWVCGRETEVSLQGGFASQANLDLILELSEEAANEELEFILGDETVSGKLSPGINSIHIKFSNPTPVDTLRIKVKDSVNSSLEGASKFVRILWGTGGN